MRNFGLALVLGLLAAVSANADTFTTNPMIEDFGGTAGPVFSQTFALGAVASVDSFEIDLSHSWASDVVVTLTASDGSVFDILDGTDGGSDDFGDGESLLAGVTTYTFVETGGATLGGTGTNGGNPIPATTFDAATWATGPFAAGDWTIDVSDDAGGDDGALGAITLNYTAAIPEPTSVAILFGMAGMAVVRRRR